MAIWSKKNPPNPYDTQNVSDNTLPDTSDSLGTIIGAGGLGAGGLGAIGAIGTSSPLDSQYYGSVARANALSKQLRDMQREHEFLKGTIAHADIDCIHCGKPKSEIEGCEVNPCTRKQDMMRMLPTMTPAEETKSAGTYSASSIYGVAAHANDIQNVALSQLSEDMQRVSLGIADSNTQAILSQEPPSPKSPKK